MSHRSTMRSIKISHKTHRIKLNEITKHPRPAEMNNSFREERSKSLYKSKNSRREKDRLLREVQLRGNIKHNILFFFTISQVRKNAQRSLVEEEKKLTQIEPPMTIQREIDRRCVTASDLRVRALCSLYCEIFSSRSCSMAASL